MPAAAAGFVLAVALLLRFKITIRPGAGRRLNFHRQRFLLWTLFLTGIGAHSALSAQSSLKATAESVLNKLYLTNGNNLYHKPAIEIVNDDRHAAQFVRSRNSILLGKKTFEVCRVFGKDSLSALAFIIGHEMAHAFQVSTRETSFLTYDREKDMSTEAENEADIQGLFNTWLAGYNTLDLLPYLIEGIYVAYDLKRKEQPGYPTLEERKRSAREMLRITGDLIRMFETGNYLTAIGHHDLAIACYRHVESRYKGREVYYQLGVNMMLQAINLSEKNVDPYIFAPEPDCDSRLKKPRAEGSADLTPEQWQQRGELLAGAAEHFALVVKMDGEYLPAETAYLCALILNAKAPEALAYAEQQELLKKAGRANGAGQEKLKLTLALAHAYNRDKAAFALLENLKNATDGFVGYAAGYNLDVLAGKSPALREKAGCQFNFDTGALIDNIAVEHPPNADWTPLEGAAGVETTTLSNPNSILIVFRSNGQNRLSLQLVKKGNPVNLASSDPHQNRTAGTRGFIEVCRDQQVAMATGSAPARTVAWVKYFEFKSK